MSTKSKSTDMRGLISLTKTTQTLLAHFQSSLSPSQTSSTPSVALIPGSSSVPEPNPLEIVKVATTLLKSHTTTLSLLLLTPPLTPSAIVKKIGDVSSEVLSNLVAAASGTAIQGQKDQLGDLMRVELRIQARRLIGTWGEVLALVLRFAEKREKATGKDEGPTESERQDVLAATGVVWEACDSLLKVCQDGVVGLVVKKAEQWRSVLMDAVEELKEWGEDVADEDDEDKAEGSDEEDGGFGDEDDIFGAANKLGKGDKDLKTLLDDSVKRLKKVSMLYQALIKRRLKTFPQSPVSADATNGESTEALADPIQTLDQLMVLLKGIPETVDDLASAFYDLDEEEAKDTLDKCCREAKSAVDLVKKSWTGTDDVFTTWSGKWTAALEAA
ncbi:hypothetical protein K504DRAFT_464496 [Pleomassaria siparia CBS 279.74]|uniref:Cyclin-D1-binding protein 1-like N-terminal domain-containing protein n=1 Tax=Pleomassaria siparia CBS 279.74 TaxID=1314801 RepID=A0A6G1KIU3_9PLEO|nr:hypothetical protein K504DRAFT_464496 [Pleomassaria siparia CBS 279.74]